MSRKVKLHYPRPKRVSSLTSFYLATTLCRDKYPEIWNLIGETTVPMFDLRLGSDLEHICEHALDKVKLATDLTLHGADKAVNVIADGTL